MNKFARVLLQPVGYNTIMLFLLLSSAAFQGYAKGAPTALHRRSGGFFAGVGARFIALAKKPPDLPKGAIMHDHNNDAVHDHEHEDHHDHDHEHGHDHTHDEE